MNNGKKYLIIGVSVLFFLIILVAILQSLLNKGGSPGVKVNRPIPTPFSGGRQGGSQGSINNTSSSPGSQGSGTGADPTSQELPAVTLERRRNELITKLPIETDDFVISYSPVMDKIVVTRKTPNAEENLSVWGKENGYSDVISDYNLTLVTNQTTKELESVLNVPTKSLEQISIEQTDSLMGLVHTILNLPNIFASKSSEVNENTKNQPTPTPTLSPTPRPTAFPIPSGEPKTYDGYVYYSQCHGPYDNYPLAPGCTVCKAGCGPTTVAMILSTYVDKKYTPPAVVEIYKDIGGAACGTGLGYAKSVLNSHGVKTSDYIVPWTGKQWDAKEVVDDFRAYLNNGWTIFVLAVYPGGHYFWVTDVDANGNVMGFDPYYGMDQTPPINENVRYPYPKYTAAFGVKKQ